MVPQARLCIVQKSTDSDREKARLQFGLSVQQQAQLERLYAEADKKEKVIGEQLHALYDQQRALYDTYVIDHAQERDLRKKIQQMHEQVLQIHADTEYGLRKILTREQFDDMSTVLNARRRGNPRGRGWHGRKEHEREPRREDQEHSHREERIRNPLSTIPT